MNTYGAPPRRRCCEWTIRGKLRCIGGRMNRLNFGFYVVFVALGMLGCSDGGAGTPEEDGGMADGDARMSTDGGDASLDADAGTSAWMPTGGRIALGDGYTLALDAEGRLVRWGASSSRVLPDAPGYRYVASGAENACALDANSQVSCWRHINFDGPVETPEDRGPYTQVTVGGYRSGEYACGLRPDGSVHCWRAGARDEYEGRLSPPSDVRFVKIDAGWLSVCGITLDNALACWGDESLETGISRNVPEGRYVDVAVGQVRACAVAEDTSVLCWGGAGSHLLHQLDPARMPIRIEMMPNSDAGCVLQRDGGVLCADVAALNEQVDDETLRFAELAMYGDRDVCGITLNDEVVCWGSSSRDSRQPPDDFRILPR